MKDYYNKKLALVTGGASGIGKSLSEQLASRGATVIITDIDGKGAEEVAGAIRAKGGNAFSYQMNVTDTAAVSSAADTILNKHGMIDLLFNNAGIATVGDFLSIPAEEWDAIFKINVMGIVNCSNAFVPSMIRKSAGGHVINTVSAAGYFPNSYMAAYVATKYAALGISGCQRLEWEKYGIRVTAVCPGIIHTNIIKNMRVFGVAARAGIKENIEKGYIKRGYSPDKVAMVVLNNLSRSPFILPVSPESWVMYLLMRLKPSSTYLQKRLGRSRG